MVRMVNRLQDARRRLRWKLALSYLAVTIGTVLVAVLIAAFLLMRFILVPNELLTRQLWFEAANRNMVPALRHLLSQSPPDTEIIRMMLADADATITSQDVFQLGAVAFSVRSLAALDILVVAGDGSLLAASNSTFAPRAKTEHPLDEEAVQGMSPPIQAALLEEDGPLRLALAGESNPERLFAIVEPNDKFLFAVPVFGQGVDRRRVLGVILANLRSLPTEDDLSAHTLLVAGRSLLLFLIGAGILGTLFGSLTAGEIVRRFRRLSGAANAWSQGDFSQFIDDPKGDELSQLAGRLNGMARQLQILLQKRQQMAVAEARNRLARDLHDSAKQQAFAASAQLGAVAELIDQDPQGAKMHLIEAEKLVNKVRKELTSLILELRPVDLSGGELGEALRAYAIDWAHQNDVEVAVQVEGQRPLALEIEEGLFRITQEALANTARHSQAQHVTISLVYEGDGVTLTISDDGQGFEAGQVKRGLGLQSMQERSELINARLSLDSSAGQGTRVSVEVGGRLPPDVI